MTTITAPNDMSHDMLKNRIGKFRIDIYFFEKELTALLLLFHNIIVLDTKLVEMTSIAEYTAISPYFDLLPDKPGDSDIPLYMLHFTKRDGHIVKLEWVRQPNF